MFGISVESKVFPTAYQEGVLEKETEAGGMKTLLFSIQELHAKESVVARSNPPFRAIALPLTAEDARSLRPVDAPFVHT